MPDNSTLQEEDIGNDKQHLENFFVALCFEVSMALGIGHNQLIAERHSRKSFVSGNYEFVEFVCNWHGLFTTIVVTKHVERVSLLQVVDFSRDPSSSNARVKLRCNIPFGDSLTRLYDEIDLYMNDNREMIGRVTSIKYTELDQPRISEDDTRALTEMSRKFFFDLWTLFDEQFGIIQIESEPPPHLPFVALFADFRGFILPAKVDYIVNPNIPHPYNLDALTSQMGDGTQGGSEARDNMLILSRYWELIKVSEPNIWRKDLIACTCLGNRAIYISSLGHTTTVERFEVEPLKYFLIIKVPNRRQIGRAVDRIHGMGAFRLLALRNLQCFIEADLELMTMGRKLDQIQMNEADTILAEGAINDFLNRLWLIGKEAHGGLFYRVNRSKAYVARFEALLSTMRMQRIEGFQPYQDFVRGRLYTQYALISSVGDRVAQIRSRFASFLEALQTTNSIRIQQNTNTVLQNSYAVLERNSRLAEAGRVVEFAAVTYYLGHVVEALIMSILLSRGDHVEESAKAWVMVGSYSLAFAGWALAGRKIKRTMQLIVGRIGRIAVELSDTGDAELDKD